MKQFDPAGRIEFEKGIKDAVSRQVLEEVSRIEAKARALKRENKHPQSELAPEIESLKARAALGYQQQAQFYQETLGEYEKKWKKERDRHPNNELARLNRARNRIDVLTDQECVELALAYGQDPESLETEEANLLAARLRGTKEGSAYYEQLRDDMRNAHANQPWLKDPNAASLYRDMKMIENTQPGKAVFDAEGQVMQIDIEELIDFDGRLDSPA